MKAQEKVANRTSALLGKIQRGHQGAINQLLKLGKRYPKHPVVTNALGCLALEKGQGSEALEHFARAKRQGYPNLNEQQRNCLIAHAMLGDSSGFDTLWHEITACKSDPAREIALLRSALKAARAKRQTALIECCLTLWQERDAEDPALALSQVSLLLHENRRDEALEHLKNLPPIPAENIASLLLAAQYAHKLKHPAVVHYFSKACEAQPTDANQLQRLIALGTNIRQFKKVISLFDVLFENYPDLAESKLYDRLNVYQQANYWDEIERLVPEYLDAVRNGRIRPGGLFRHLSLPGLTDADHLMLANAYLSGKPPVTEPPPDSVFQRQLRAGRKLRIGFLSADFKQHPVAQLIMEVLEQADHDNYEWIAYDVAEPHESYWRKRILATFDQVVAVRELNESEFIERLRSDQLDILVEMQGDTTDTRAWWLRQRVAPVQISWLGFISTIGQGISDYILADRHLIPEPSREYFGEKVIWLPDISFPADTQREAPPPPPRMLADLPEDAVVYCSFNAHYKITRETFKAWVAIVKQVDNAVLWLFDQAPDSTAQLRDAAEVLGLEASRLIFAGRKPHTEHLARLQLADVALDSWPYNSGATAIDTLWCGVPLVTKGDATMMSRVATGMVHTLGLPELATTMVDEFIRVAVELGKNVQQRQAIKARLIEARERSPLYQPERFARHLECAFDQAFARFEQGKAPEHIQVTPIETWVDDEETTSKESSVQVLLERGDYFLQQEKLDEAKQHFEQTLKQDPESPMAHYGLGMIYGLCGKYDAALEKMQYAAVTDPENKRFTDHLKVMEKKAAQNWQSELKGLLNQGLRLHEKGELQHATAIYEAILSKSPRHPMALHYLGLLEVQQNKQEGLDKMLQSLKFQPHNETFLNNYNKAKSKYVMGTNNDEQ